MRHNKVRGYNGAGGDYKIYCLLTCDVVLIGRWISAFGRKLLLTFLLRMRQRILPTYSYLSTRLHGVTFQKTVIFSATLNRNV
jgi:hypothetical protein